MALLQKSMTNLHTSRARVRVEVKNSTAIPLLHQDSQMNTQISCEKDSNVGIQSNLAKIHMTSKCVIRRLIIQVGWNHLVIMVDPRPIPVHRHTVTSKDLLQRETLTYFRKDQGISILTAFTMTSARLQDIDLCTMDSWLMRSPTPSSLKARNCSPRRIFQNMNLRQPGKVQ